jgi:S-DNA-T family DNA segregation ATPase FtsK/SpoIIIE
VTVRIATHELVGLLADLSLTAADPADSGATAGILLHTARGYVGESPGATDLLVGTATDGVVIGHAHTGCAGQMEPMLWPIGDVRAVIAVLRPLGKDKNHGVELSQDGDTIKVAEDPDLFGEGLTLTFNGYAVDEFPHDGVRAMLTEVQISPPEGSPPAAPRTDLAPSRLAPFLKVAARRAELVQMFRYHQRLPVTIQIGVQYRGMVSQFKWRDEDSAAGAAPGGDVYPLDVQLPGEA